MRKTKGIIELLAGAEALELLKLLKSQLVGKDTNERCFCGRYVTTRPCWMLSSFKGLLLPLPKHSLELHFLQTANSFLLDKPVLGSTDLLPLAVSLEKI